MAAAGVSPEHVEGLCRLLVACWFSEPLQRPPMSVVLEALGSSGDGLALGSDVLSHPPFAVAAAATGLSGAAAARVPIEAGAVAAELLTGARAERVPVTSVAAPAAAAAGAAAPFPTAASLSGSFFDAEAARLRTSSSVASDPSAGAAVRGASTASASSVAAAAAAVEAPGSEVTPTTAPAVAAALQLALPSLFHAKTVTVHKPTRCMPCAESASCMSERCPLVHPGEYCPHDADTAAGEYCPYADDEAEAAARSAAEAVARRGLASADSSDGSASVAASEGSAAFADADAVTAASAVDDVVDRPRLAAMCQTCNDGDECFEDDCAFVHPGQLCRHGEDVLAGAVCPYVEKQHRESGRSDVAHREVACFRGIFCGFGRRCLFWHPGQRRPGEASAGAAAGARAAAAGGAGSPVAVASAASTGAALAGSAAAAAPIAGPSICQACNAGPHCGVAACKFAHPGELCPHGADVVKGKLCDFICERHETSGRPANAAACDRCYRGTLCTREGSCACVHPGQRCAHGADVLSGELCSELLRIHAESGRLHVASTCVPCRFGTRCEKGSKCRFVHAGQLCCHGSDVLAGFYDKCPLPAHARGSGAGSDGFAKGTAAGAGSISPAALERGRSAVRLPRPASAAALGIGVGVGSRTPSTGPPALPPAASAGLSMSRAPSGGPAPRAQSGGPAPARPGDAAAALLLPMRAPSGGPPPPDARAAEVRPPAPSGSPVVSAAAAAAVAAEVGGVARSSTPGSGDGSGADGGGGASPVRLYAPDMASESWGDMAAAAAAAVVAASRADDRAAAASTTTEAAAATAADALRSPTPRSRAASGEAPAIAATTAAAAAARGDAFNRPSGAAGSHRDDGSSDAGSSDAGSSDHDHGHGCDHDHGHGHGHGHGHLVGRGDLERDRRPRDRAATCRPCRQGARCPAADAAPPLRCGFMHPGQLCKHGIDILRGDSCQYIASLHRESGRPDLARNSHEACKYGLDCRGPHGGFCPLWHPGQRRAHEPPAIVADGDAAVRREGPGGGPGPAHGGAGAAAAPEPERRAQSCQACYNGERCLHERCLFVHPGQLCKHGADVLAGSWCAHIQRAHRDSGRSDSAATCELCRHGLRCNGGLECDRVHPGQMCSHGINIRADPEACPSRAHGGE